MEKKQAQESLWQGLSSVGSATVDSHEDRWVPLDWKQILWSPVSQEKKQ